MKSEHRIQDEIRIALSAYGMVFRTNAGDFWQGQRIYSREMKRDVLVNLRPVKGLPKGFSDLIFVGQGMVAFIETKRPGEEPSDEQVNFLDRMIAFGHRAGIARSVEDALQIIGVRP